MTPLINGLFLGSCAALAGCAVGRSEHFTFTADLPANFAYSAVAEYVPAKEQGCTVEITDKPNIGYNRDWRKAYKPDAQIPLYRTVKGCRLVIYRVELDIYATYGKARGDFGKHSAVVAIRGVLKEETKGTFDNARVSTFAGQCEWLFRTQGPRRRLSKSIRCKDVSAQGVASNGRPVGAYTLDQLPGKTVKLKIKLADEEKPGWGDTWVKFPNGWKRCLGKGKEDQRGYCSGNYKDFSSFIMPDGRSCTIYPGCTE